ncbi:MAG: phosphonate C-P lyase system protein PhnG [Ferruginibacter sp.]|nr:phosphonate C-P lyase system protein PhnG [Cytophagales bacterium]
MAPDRDYVLCECSLEALKTFVSDQLLPYYQVNLTKAPATCLTMVRAEDSVENQEFYLGEALTTECEVEVNGQAGYGICLGDEPDRAYCLATVDALFAAGDARLPTVEAFLAAQWAAIQQRERLEFSQIMRTKVDFKLMEQG